MTSEEKIEYVKHWVRLNQQNAANYLPCPYCFSKVVEGDILCCDTLVNCLKAIDLEGRVQVVQEAHDRIN